MTHSTPSTHDRRAFFDALASRRERDARRHSTYYRDRLDWLKNMIPSDASIAEVGSGIGWTLSRLPQTKKVGIDLSSKMIDVAKQNDASSTYVQNDVEHLTHRGEYDYVLMLDSINSLGDVQAALTSIRTNLCGERTRLVITHYNFLWQPIFMLGELLGWKTKFPEQNWLSRNDLVNLLDLTGFEVVSAGERMLCPVGIPLVEQFFNHILVTLPFLRVFGLTKTIIARPLRKERKEYSVSILSAVRNERGNIARIAQTMPTMGTRTELIFVEGHSTDGTWEEMERVRKEGNAGIEIKTFKQPGRGKGDALHFGASQATGDILMVYDGDFTVHPLELRKQYDILADGRAELVNASRLVYPLEKGAMRLKNLIGNKVFSAMFSWLFMQKLVDTLSPVKALFRHHYKKMTLRRDPFGDFDLFFGASAQQLKMREVPIHYLERTYGVTKMRPFKHAWMLLKMFFFGARKLRWN